MYTIANKVHNTDIDTCMQVHIDVYNQKQRKNFVLNCVSLRMYMRTGLSVCVNVNFVLDCINVCVYKHTRVNVCPVNALDCTVLMTQSDRKLRHHTNCQSA